MFEDGLIYRGGRMVNWDPKMKTTVADDEVEYIEQKAKFYYSKKLNWRKIQETPISDVYLNPGHTPKIKKQKPFLSLAFLQGLVLVYFLALLSLYLKLKEPLHSSNSKL